MANRKLVCSHAYTITKPPSSPSRPLGHGDATDCVGAETGKKKKEERKKGAEKEMGAGGFVKWGPFCRRIAFVRRALLSVSSKMRIHGGHTLATI